MCKTRSEQSKKEGILSVVLYSDLGLCVELGDEKIDDDGIYGYAPTQGFIKALKKEIEFHVENTIGSLSEHPTLRRVATLGCFEYPTNLGLCLLSFKEPPNPTRCSLEASGTKGESSNANAKR